MNNNAMVGSYRKQRAVSSEENYRLVPTTSSILHTNFEA